MHREHGRLAPATCENQDGAENEGVGLGDDREAEVNGLFLESAERKAIESKEVETLHHIAHDHNAEQEEAVGKAGENEGLLRCAHGRGLVIPETNQQVARYTHEFPENEHLEKVGGGNEAEHAKAEQRKNREESAGTAVALHVANAVDVHEERNYRDDHKHHDRKRVD